MNVFVICNKSPYPPKEGGPIAMHAIIQGLVNAGCSVKVLAINTNKYNINLQDIPEEFREKTGIEFEYINLSIKPVAAFFNLFTKRSYHVQRFISHRFEECLIDILRKNTFDIIQFETLYITPYINAIRKYSNARIVLRAHNIEHLIWKRVAKTTSNPLKKLYLNHLYKTLERYERQALDQFDGIATITKQDALILSKYTSRPVRDISFGVNTNKFPEPKEYFEFPSLFHIGAMNWMPNAEGIKWFLHNVWPLTTKKFPQLKFYLAGREMPDWLTNLKTKNIVVLGEVEDAYEFMQSKAIMIVPLLSGSGIRIKIIEGMALGKAIVSSEIGAEGIKYTNAKNILIANTVEDYLEAISQCIDSLDLTKRIGGEARKLVFTEHNNEKIISKLIKFYQEIL